MSASREHFETLAQYNRWANARLYEACAALSDADYRAARLSFFGSIRNTLNHVLVADRLWLARIEGVDGGSLALDTILHDALGDLRRAREAEDERIADVVAQRDETALASDLVYRNVAGHEFRTPLSWVFTQLFNHQTHHRGQVHDMLSQTPVAPPPLDLIYFLREPSVARRVPEKT